MRKNILGGMIVIALFGTACGHKQTKYGSDQTVTSEVAPGVGLAVHVNWVKVKKDKLDLEVVLTNTSKEIVKLASYSLRLTYNGEPGVANQHGSFMNSLGTAIGPNHAQSGYAYFTFSHPVTGGGTAVLTVDPILASSTDDPTKENWRKLQPITMQLNVN